MHWFFKVIFVATIFILLWLLIFIILPKILPTQTISNSKISGFIIRNQVWEGTIRIVGDTFSAKSTKITIKPGTQILVAINNDKFNLDYLPWHLKEGVNTLKNEQGIRVGEPFWNEKAKIQLHLSNVFALGTKEQPIIIKSDAESVSPYDFNILQIENGVLSNVIASNYRRFEAGSGITIRDSTFKNIGECAICLNYGEPNIINNIFGDIFREAIWVSSSSPKIENNLFANLIGDGIRIDPQRIGAPKILHNTFEMPSHLAIDILTGDEQEAGIISNNKFSGNSRITLPCDSKITFLQNEILSFINFKTGSCAGSYTFSENYWGVDDIKIILSERINKEKQFQILIPQILKVAPQEVGRI